VDTSNPALAIACPRCDLLTARFLKYCSNCGFMLWRSGEEASAAFMAWKQADPARRGARRYDTSLPIDQVSTVDYDERAHELGIHLPPPTKSPIVICVGFFFLALAAIPFPAAGRIALGAFGAVIFLIGVLGWVVVEDMRMFPKDGGSAHGNHPASASNGRSPSSGNEDHA
jgi:hypothetical protein